MKKKWMGTFDKCNICGKPFPKKGCFYDHKTVMGPWSLSCQSCFEKVGVGLGLGFGQKYDIVTKNKIAG